jgi:hypothetical protein
MKFRRGGASSRPLPLGPSWAIRLARTKAALGFVDSLELPALLTRLPLAR